MSPSNRLAAAASPYLRQHAENPVDWYEWGDEAFERARQTDRPVFLSVGYSACHWCHVMAHESFEDPDTAADLNRDFVAIKVDREERPDVDAVYMHAVQALTGRGGWPMSVFLAPDGRPFFGGTYWPRDDRAGMPGFRRVLASVAEVWRDQRGQIDESGDRLTARLRQMSGSPATAGRVDDATAATAAERAVSAWDRHDGGFGDAPKFPQAMLIDFLLAHALRTGDDDARQAALSSLTAMAHGGIYDHVGGGFARYATDRRWLVPHFEKMLYDNALLVRAYTHAAQITGDARHHRVVAETIAWMLDELRHDAGGLACALDADSEGQEGRYYVWRYDEFAAVVASVGADPAVWAARLGVSERGNVNDPHGHIPPGTSILHLPPTASTAPPAWQSTGRDVAAADFDEGVDEMGVDETGAADPGADNPGVDETGAADPGADEPGSDEPGADGMDDEWGRVREALASARAQRVRPALDDKVLVSWNALAFGAIAEAGAALGRPDWIAAARRSAEFLADTLVGAGPDGAPRLWHRWTPEHGPGIAAFGEDVAYLAQALLSLYEADHDPRWLSWARELADDADRRFRDDDGTYFTTAADAAPLVARPRELLDNATPAVSSVMVDVHLRLAGLTGSPQHRDRALQTLSTLAAAAAQMPLAFGALLTALERHLTGSTEVAIVGAADAARDALVAAYRRQWRTGAVLAVGSGDHDDADANGVALLVDRPPVDGDATAYVCHDFACELPVTTPAQLGAQLDGDSDDALPR